MDGFVFVGQLSRYVDSTILMAAVYRVSGENTQGKNEKI
jgi:hypothetical protein